METEGRDTSLRPSENESLSSVLCEGSGRGCDCRVLYVEDEGRVGGWSKSDGRFCIEFFFAPERRLLPSYFLREGLVMCHFFNRLRSWDSLEGLE